MTVIVGRIKNWLLLPNTLIKFGLILLMTVYYCYYYPKVMFHFNDVLASYTGDSFKNYYTFMFHTVNDESFINFSGMNYPFGENMVYTDCMPIVSLLFRCLPFTFPYLIGILHFLFFTSYIFAPVVIYSIFQLYNVSKVMSIMGSVAISILAPEVLRLDYGHFAMCFSSLIPLLIYLLMKYFIKKSNRIIYFLGVYNTLIFFLHPYLGIGFSLFTLLAICLFELFNKEKGILKKILKPTCSAIIPIIIFRCFVFFTDNHIDRPVKPGGLDHFRASLESVFLPRGGPLKEVMIKLVGNVGPDIEGHSFSGSLLYFFVIGVFLVLVLNFKKINLEYKILFSVALFFLAFSFGYFHDILKMLNIEVGFVNQFRAIGRFAWFFTYAMPIACVFILFNFLKQKNKLFLGFLLVGVFSISNFIEAHYYHKYISGLIFKEKNHFNVELLNAEQQKLIELAKSNNAQAILPIPYFSVGSEIFDQYRAGFDSAHISMLVSFHAKLPIISTHLSRTSISETYQSIGLLNRYKNHDSIFLKMNNLPIFVLKVDEVKKCDELSVIKMSKPLIKLKYWEAFTLDKYALNFSKEEIKKENFVVINKSTTDSVKVIQYKESDSVEPFIYNKVANFKTIFVAKKNQYPPGKYVVSFWYHYPNKNEDNTATNIFINDQIDEKNNWLYFNGVRRSTEYKGFYVWEQNFIIEKNHEYKVLTYGENKGEFKVSNVLFRPETLNVAIKNVTFSLINNYPFNF